MIRAFISCEFPPSKEIDIICGMLKPEINPIISNTVKVGNIAEKIREEILRSDCLIAIITDKEASAFVENEVGIAFGLGKPIFAIYEESIDVKGIQPYLSTFIKYPSGKTEKIAKEIDSLKNEALNQKTLFEIQGSQQDLVDNVRQNGVLGIYPDRSTAFRKFKSVWDRENQIFIVGSSIEGFKRGIGSDAKELFSEKLKNKDSKIKILLTHNSFAKYREKQESEKVGYIGYQIKRTTNMLAEIKTGENSNLEWKFFKGAPTCFMIIAGDFMLINPYLYMHPAYFNFSMIVKNTQADFDIYNRYKNYHFGRAWESPELSVRDP